jgi:AGCS family alanine or glycine:cation symporter
MTALAASIGTGNIAGVATAVVSGGPGAVFWIWCYGFFATTIKLTEAVLGIRFRVLGGSRLSAGPMHYLRDGLGLPRLGWLYALIAGVAALTTTPFTQPNSIAVVLESQLKIPTLTSGIVVAILAWLVIIGGVRSIGRAAEKLSPLKVILYVAGGLFVILTHASQVPSVLALIFREAFSLKAASGSAAGIGIMVAMRYGLARGIYANEAGYGTAAVAYGTARSERPVQQGLNAVMEVFIVSCVTSSISALTILVSGVWQSGLTSTAVVAEAFNTAIPVAGGWIVAFCAFLFGYTTLIGWAYYGEQFLEHVLGPKVVLPYRWVYCGLIVFGAVAEVKTVWAWGDLMNGLQVFPNLVGVIGLSGLVARALREDGGRRAP